MFLAKMYSIQEKSGAGAEWKAIVITKQGAAARQQDYASDDAVRSMTSAPPRSTAPPKPPPPSHIARAEFKRWHVPLPISIVRTRAVLEQDTGIGIFMSQSHPASKSKHLPRNYRPIIA